MAETRKHPRINIKDEFKRASALKGAAFNIGEDSFEIFDMSMSGMALRSVPEVKVGDSIHGLIGLGDEDPEELTVEVVWLNSDLMGVRFLHCEASVRLSIADFLEDRLVGQHMIEVGSQYFAEHVDFHRWFHGAGNTNVFLWKSRDPALAEKISVAFDGQSVVFRGGEFFSGGKGPDWSEQSTYSAEALPTRDSSELSVQLEKDSPLVRRAIELLAQLSDKEPAIQTLLRSLEPQ